MPSDMPKPIAYEIIPVMMLYTAQHRRNFPYRVTAQGCFERLSTTSDRSWSYSLTTLDGEKATLHRLALAGKLGRPIAPGHWACHTCDNPRCINPDHLFEGRPQDNTQDCLQKGRRNTYRIPPMPESQNPTSKLTEADVELIWLLLKANLPHSAIAALFGVHKSLISHIKRGKVWSHLKPSTDESI
ncbi:MAG: HNH endonuclease [Drouetiella hepatica Uher 2000/2452]|uniref:HNH endonuclease n=1 Tax=Drouetiella hepatica Uher 2000/2452 TaxID=904376 RepID=A0A951QHR8_9CYAN|nr:HNH endonuclease [Drouetiella hepatica Uher 2000/2452]